MNVQFTWATGFDATIVLDSEILPNTYNIAVTLVTNTTEQNDQIQAFEKVKFFLTEFLKHGCFVETNTPVMALLQEHFDQRIIELPVQPSDLIIGAVIFQKINSIIDEYLILDSLEIHSSLGGNVSYTIEHTDKFSELNQPTWASEAWWLDPGLKTSNTDTLPEGIVIDWSYLDMETTKDKSAKQKFCPTIINGGKHEPESQG